MQHIQNYKSIPILINLLFYLIINCTWIFISQKFKLICKRFNSFHSLFSKQKVSLLFISLELSLKLGILLHLSKKRHPNKYFIIIFIVLMIFFIDFFFNLKNIFVKYIYNGMLNRISKYAFSNIY